MPREVIHPTRPLQEGERRFQAVVGWNRDMDVQVGIQTEDDHHVVDYIYGDPHTRAKIARLLLDKLGERSLLQPMDFASSDVEQAFMEAVGRDVLDAVTGSEYFGTSVWWHPDRAQINRLIRLLRKARDLAYGRDE